MSRLIFLLFQALPNSAWADGKLAELAEQLGKTVEHSRSKSMQHNYLSRCPSLYLFSVFLVLLIGHVEEVYVVEELVVGQRVEHAAHVEDQAWNEKCEFGEFIVASNVGFTELSQIKVGLALEFGLHYTSLACDCSGHDGDCQRDSEGHRLRKSWHCTTLVVDLTCFWKKPL